MEKANQYDIENHPDWFYKDKKGDIYPYYNYRFAFWGEKGWAGPRSAET